MFPVGTSKLETGDQEMTRTFTGLVDANSSSSGGERAYLPEPDRPLHTNGSDAEHNVLKHISKDPNGEICKRTKITRVRYRRHTKIDIPRAERLSDLITADHEVLSED